MTSGKNKLWHKSRDNNAFCLFAIHPRFVWHIMLLVSLCCFWHSTFCLFGGCAAHILLLLLKLIAICRICYLQCFPHGLQIVCFTLLLNKWCQLCQCKILNRSRVLWFLWGCYKEQQDKVHSSGCVHCVLLSLPCVKCFESSVILQGKVFGY